MYVIIFYGSINYVLNLVKNCLKDDSINFVDMKSQNIVSFNHKKSNFYEVTGPNKMLILEKLRKCTQDYLPTNQSRHDSVEYLFSTSMFNQN